MMQNKISISYLKVPLQMKRVPAQVEKSKKTRLCGLCKDKGHTRRRYGYQGKGVYCD